MSTCRRWAVITSNARDPRSPQPRFVDKMLTLYLGHRARCPQRASSSCAVIHSIPTQ
jgi:hypothetical protein